MAENYEKFARRNEQIKTLLDEAKGLVKKDESGRLFYCIRKASVLLEFQKSELKSLEHTRVSESENEKIRQTVAGYYSCLLQRDQVIETLRRK